MLVAQQQPAVRRSSRSSRAANECSRISDAWRLVGSGGRRGLPCGDLAPTRARCLRLPAAIQRRVTVDQPVRAKSDLRFDFQGQPEARCNARESPVVIALRQQQLAARREPFQQATQRLNHVFVRTSVVNEIAEKNDGARAVFGLERLEPGGDVVERPQRQQMSSLPLNPRIAEMNVSDDQRPFARQPGHAARVHPKPGAEVKPFSRRPITAGTWRRGRLTAS